MLTLKYYSENDDDDAALGKLDNYLCELKEMQIRDGLHIFGKTPDGRLLTDLLVALVRVPRGSGEAGDASLHTAAPSLPGPRQLVLKRPSPLLLVDGHS